MYRLANGTQVPSLPAAPAPVGTPGFGTSGNPGAGLLGSIFGAPEFNTLQEELMSFLLAAGIAPDRDNFAQVLEACRILFGGRGALLALTSATTIANATETAVPWPAPIYDDLGLWSGVSPTRLTIPAGISRVRVSCQTTWDNQESGDRKVRILRNSIGEGDGLPAMRLPSAGAADVTVLNAGGGIVQVSPGDYLQMMVFHDRGANLDLRATNTWLHLEALR
ncbi:hypothetical protein [Falsiroseomonas sp.]|uniref:hypothetical protein n=1 Tax=Falsiroseomonas sp. TaxID=2870721 RepID=UPI003F6FFD61